jgi:hypothetical protein
MTSENVFTIPHRVGAPSSNADFILRVAPSRIEGLVIYFHFIDSLDA